MTMLTRAFGIGSQVSLLQRFPIILKDSTAFLPTTCNLITPINNHQRNIKTLSLGSPKCQNSNIIIKNGLFQRWCSSNSEDPKGFQVYEGRVKGLMKRVKIFSLTTSLIGLVGQPYLWYSVQDMSLVFAAPLFTVVNFFVFANPLLIHYLAKRYVTELYYHPANQTYTATVLSFFARKETFTFTAKDVVVPEIPGLFSMLTAKGRPLFVDDRDFSSIEIYKRMMGFDKPLDLTYVANSREKSDK